MSLTHSFWKECFNMMEIATQPHDSEKSLLIHWGLSRKKQLVQSILSLDLLYKITKISGLIIKKNEIKMTLIN